MQQVVDQCVKVKIDKNEKLILPKVGVEWEYMFIIFKASF